MTRYMVWITSVNEKGKVDSYKRTVDDMVSVTRMLLTYKPKRGYECKQWTVDKIDTLL